jgi:opacity protein-like surface antigen
MRGLRIAAAALVASSLMAGSVFAADVAPESDPMSGWYLRGDAGWSWLNWDRRDDNEFVGGGGIGYRYNDNFRTDIRLDWSGFYDAVPSRDDTAITTLTVNGYYDFTFDAPVTPYLGAGVGYGWVDTWGYDGSGLALAGMAGFSFDVTEQISLDTSYRIRTIMSNEDDTVEQQIMTGVRFGF